jgi:hypothetical protein
MFSVAVRHDWCIVANSSLCRPFAHPAMAPAAAHSPGLGEESDSPGTARSITPRRGFTLAFGRDSQIAHGTLHRFRKARRPARIRRPAKKVLRGFRSVQIGNPNKHKNL